MSGSHSASSSSRWQADDESNFCSQCNDAFTFLKRRHHCRACGKLFCDECSSHKLLVPRERLLSTEDCGVPCRCCNTCARQLNPIQSDLRAIVSKANLENSIERESTNRYLNLPYSSSLGAEIRKASYTLINFTSDNMIEGQDRIPRELLMGAKGIAFLTIGKIGFLLTGRIGTGLVIARLPDGSWSAPSAIAISGFGWGFQVGGELTDVILILATQGAVDAFSSNAQVAVGTELSVSLGPVGRSAGTDLHAGDSGASAAFSYAHSKGLFLGVSLEASVITSRPEVNTAFYGQEIKPSVLLSGEFKRPKAAEPLYKALSEVLSGVEPVQVPKSIIESENASEAAPRTNSTAAYENEDALIVSSAASEDINV